MADTGQSKTSRIIIVIAVILILYNIGSGLIVKKFGIPGIFEIEFGEKPASPIDPGKQPVSPSKQNQTEPATPPSVNPSFSAPPPLPQITCPRIAGMFWMPYPNTWYGPFNGFALAWNNSGGFFVWNPYSGMITYPDPFAQVQRNTWLRLTNSSFGICVEGSTGSVFGQYIPY